MATLPIPELAAIYLVMDVLDGDPLDEAEEQQALLLREFIFKSKGGDLRLRIPENQEERRGLAEAFLSFCNACDDILEYHFRGVEPGDVVQGWTRKEWVAARQGFATLSSKMMRLPHQKGISSSPKLLPKSSGSCAASPGAERPELGLP